MRRAGEARCDVLPGLSGAHVIGVERQDGRLRVTVQSPWALMGCSECGVVASSRGRRTRVLQDVPGVVRVEVVWRQRRWACLDAGCSRGTFSEQPDSLGHRGRAGDPLYRVRNILHRAAGDFTDRQWARLTDCSGRGDPNDEVLIAWQCYQQVQSAYAADKPTDGKQVAEQVVATFPNCPIPEIARPGRTLRQWKDTYLGHFTTAGANNGGTGALNRIIELRRRSSRGYRNPDDYRLRVLLVTGGLLLPPQLR